MFNSINKQKGNTSVVVDNPGPKNGLMLEMDVESKKDSLLALIIKVSNIITIHYFF